MTTPRSYDEVLADSVRVLTEAARRTRTIGAGADNEHTEPADFAEFVTLAVAGAAANLGSIEQILAGRPGSWEADSVRQMLISTVGDDEHYLLEHRTEPLTITVNVEDLLNDLGYLELYDDADAEITRRDSAISEPTVPVDDAPEHRAVWDRYEAANDEIAALYDQVAALRTADTTTYGQAFEATVLRAAADLYPNLRVPVQVAVELQWQNSLGSGEDFTGPAAVLFEKARLDTPLPGSGIAPKDYPLEPSSSVAQVERDNGRRPLDRLSPAQ